MELLSSGNGYSAQVNLELRLPSGEYVDVAQTGPKSLILREASEIPLGPATLVVTVDGHRDEYDIILSRIADCSREVFYF